MTAILTTFQRECLCSLFYWLWERGVDSDRGAMIGSICFAWFSVSLCALGTSAKCANDCQAGSLAMIASFQYPALPSSQWNNQHPLCRTDFRKAASSGMVLTCCQHAPSRRAKQRTHCIILDRFRRGKQSELWAVKYPTNQLQVGVNKEVMM